ncbi:hypothetical protein [Amycolatopsis vastitatis]|uniref:Uncharacterized protein n=1 Tax=Amycolatopsis vastitatis TaxID=1905142 RepID=A0A229SKS3_9PSEU|nr:hypothetical protein [Amycolatopsis vastitatis]OXM59577.1 hypothetical protein CF165_46945 [Amycolatopsis vastitatis]
MSPTNRNNRTAVTDDRHLHAVTDNPGQQNTPNTEDKVHAALAATPGSTTATLAIAAGVGRSTAAKILARWDRDGTVIRTAGDSPRNPSTWILASSGCDPAAPATEGTQPDATAPPSSDQATDYASDTDDTSTPQQTVPTTATSTDGNDSTPDTTTAEGPGSAPKTDDDTDATIDEAPTLPADTKVGSTTPPPGAAPMDPADARTEPTPTSAVTPAASDVTGIVPTDGERLPKGGLRALVEEYLTEHPGKDFGPAKIGKVLGRSGGAVNNALEKLVADGYAIKTCEAPKRFAINPDKTDVPATADGIE